ncbi:hypothetical protein EBB54_14770 [Schaedlerella arabinosiphila]|jgi:hypothetical protein|uniref:UDP-N-acetylglucosamine 2-epimerase domain-containing protein n=1 Tax=Schaedlerella arabinosiphila TaxID=2044587 RepID=A0A3R8KV34_9FIRM|nr:hypothetical protein [Schaedlerella arabinosiphila]RRK32482.1 hypothetical protein EBB54_14770 [Schaedlerella arabinosiphila]
MNHDEFIFELNKVNLKGLEEIPIGELLATIYFEREGIGNTKLLKSILTSIVLDKNEYYIYQDAKIWLISTYSYFGRADLRHQFENVANCIKHRGIIFPKKEISFQVKRLRYLPLIFCWRKELKKTNFNKKIQYRMIAETFKALIIAEEAVKIIKNNSKAKICVTFCDVHPPDYLITFMLNKCGIKTATLQHGVYDHISRYEFAHSHSDYFLAINEHAKEEAILSGLNEKKVCVLGPLSYIDETPMVRSLVKRDKTYGILLNGARAGRLEGEDRKLLDFAYLLTKEKKFSVIVRPHPLGDVPEHRIKKIQQYSECPGNIQLRDFLSQCDFVLTGSTTAYIDAFIFGCPAYRYIGIHDYFPQINKFCFSDKYQLEGEIIDYYTKNEEQLLHEVQTVRQYFIPDGSIKKYYQLFFKECTNE